MSKGAISVKEKGFVKLSQTPIKIKSKVQQPKFARVVPCGNHIVVEIGYQQEITLKPSNGRISAIDLGLNNLATLVSNIKELKPLLFNGKPLKSINQFANKEIAKEQGLLDTGKKTNRNKINKIFLKRKHKITNYMHKVSREIVNYLVSNQITSLVIGKNKGWKQDINLGKRNNQNFVYVPFNKFTEILKYKYSLQGIEVSLISENYTSKCSFFDDEAIKKHLNYAGKRIKRGLFRIANGMVVNADVNGAYNILKKYLLETGKGKLNSVEVCSMPEKFTLKS